MVLVPFVIQDRILLIIFSLVVELLLDLLHFGLRNAILFGKIGRGRTLFLWALAHLSGGDLLNV